MTTHVELENAQKNSKETAETCTAHMRDHVSPISILVTLLSPITKVDQSSRHDIGTHVHQEEKRPDQKEDPDDQSKDSWESKMEVLERKHIKVPSGYGLRAEGEDQEYPEVQEKYHKNSLN